MGDKKNAHRVSFGEGGSLKEKKNMKDTGVDGNIISKRILKE